MKRIRTLEGPTPGPARYLAHAGAEATWERFRRNQDHRHELAEALAYLQRRLCGYCEINLREGDRQIEHVIPRSDPKHGVARALDPANLIVCCLGGTRKADDEHSLPTTPASVRCGQDKTNSANPDFIDPRTLPALPALTRVRYDGRIEADQDVCERVGFSAKAINKTINTLGLNVERLRIAREKRWRRLVDAWQEHHSDPAVMEAAARSELLSSSDEGSLPRFFTASRSYFAELGERILAENPAAWV